MSITIESPEAEALLTDLAARTRRSPPDLLLDLLRRERERLADERAREDEAAIAGHRVGVPVARTRSRIAFDRSPADRRNPGLR